MRIRLLTAALLLAACQQPPVLQAPVASAVSPAAQLRAEGDALMGRGDYPGAVEKFRQAVDLEPASVPLRFALGTAYSFLEKRPETIAQFRWVVANAAAGSAEHQAARRWLVQVGALVEEPVAAAQTAGAATDDKKTDATASGSVVGETRWAGVGPGQEPIPLRISLIGRDEGNQHVGLRRNVSLGERFDFKDVPEGEYRLVGIFDDRIVWDRRVSVKGGKQTEVALDQSASTAPPSTFPLRVPATR
ncbi:MAG TPA: tetratricopeptide repeat protein [Methylomirabilota bacterium]|nr:tetratricopeptide repeat protein [Methylomirabilota bacterium]